MFEFVRLFDYARRRASSRRNVQLSVIGGASAGESSVAQSAAVDRRCCVVERRVRRAVCGVGAAVDCSGVHFCGPRLLQVFFTIRSEERLLVEQIDHNLLFRWFVGLGMDDAMWNHAVSPRTATVSDLLPIRSSNLEACVTRKRSARMKLEHGDSPPHDQYTTIVRSKPSQMVLNHPKSTRP